MPLSLVRDPGSWGSALSRIPTYRSLATFDHVHASTLLYDDGAWAEAAVLETPDGIVFHPYIRRPVPQAPELTDLVSAYEFGGFWCSPDEPGRRARLLALFAELFHKRAAEEGIVCEFGRLHPFQPVAGLESGYQVVVHQEHAVVRLDAPLPDLRGRYTAPRRRLVRQGQRFGLTFQRVDDPATLLECMNENLARLAAKKFYYFPLEFLRSVMPNAALFHIVTAEGNVAGAHMYLTDDDIAYAFLPHSREEYFSLRPNDFGYDAFIAWGLENGLKALHLGGGTEDLVRYKRSFGAELIAYHHIRGVFLPDTYQRLSSGSAGKFFPAYRAKPGI